MANNIPASVVEKYIDGYFKIKYPVSEKKQPHFWDAVKKLSEDINADVSSLINDEDPFCIGESSKTFIHIGRNDKTIKTVTDLAKKIASEIITEESKTAFQFDLFILTKKIKALEEQIKYSNPGGGIYS